MSNILDDNALDIQPKPLAITTVVGLYGLQIILLFGIGFLFNYLDTIPAIHRNSGWLGLGFVLILIFSTILILKFRLQIAWNAAILMTFVIFVLELFIIAFVGSMGLWISIASYSLTNILIIELLAFKQHSSDVSKS